MNAPQDAWQRTAPPASAGAEHRSANGPVPFLDLHAINMSHGDALKAALARVIDSGWYVLGSEVTQFEQA